jgi:hypothetical protein
MDVGRLSVFTGDVECLAIQEACQRTAHRRSEIVQLLGIKGALAALHIAFEFLLLTDSYTRRACSGPAKGNVPVLEGDKDPTY